MYNDPSKGKMAIYDWIHLEIRHTFTPRVENTSNKRRKSEKPLKGEKLSTCSLKKFSYSKSRSTPFSSVESLFLSCRLNAVAKVLIFSQSNAKQYDFFYM